MSDAQYCIDSGGVKWCHAFILLFQSEPRYVPLKLHESQEKNSDADSDDSSVKSVRFSKLTEVIVQYICSKSEVSFIKDLCQHCIYIIIHLF